MEPTKLCLTLTGETLEEDLELLNKYRSYVDMAELRVDYLADDEKLQIRRFPEMAGIPCVLTIRRDGDGGKFTDGEAARSILFARALSFAESDNNKNFKYVDFEEDYHIPSLEDAALAFGTKIIRSCHDMEKPVGDIIAKLRSLNSSGFEIPKIAFMPKSIDDVTELFQKTQQLQDNNHIILAMGPLGTPSRILGAKLKNYLTYTSPIENSGNLMDLGHLDPVELNDTYHVRKITENTKIYGITGWPLSGTSSPALHNKGYTSLNMDAVYIPMRAQRFDQAFKFAESIGCQGMSVTVPHKEKVLEAANFLDENVQEIGASNTLVREAVEVEVNGEKVTDIRWNAYNTDVTGFTKSLLEFLGTKNLRFRKVAIIGAGGAARAIAYSIKKLHGKACIFNRTTSKARTLAEKFGFKYASLGVENISLLRKYSDIIIQTTSVGMHSTEPSNPQNDPIHFYEFDGHEKIFDIIYMPETTPIMARAKQAGCKVINGFDMLKYQGYEQFELFTKQKHPDDK